MSNLFDQTVAEIKSDLLYRRPMRECPQITGGEQAAELLRLSWPEINFVERFRILYLNRSNRVICRKELSVGGMVGTVVDIKIIIKSALDCGAQNIILAHNHPSGTLVPSDADIRITDRIKDAALFFDIKVLDHIIVTDDNFYSFANDGQL